MIPFTVLLPDDLATEYMEESRWNGRPVKELILRDLQNYQESKRFHANRREMTHP